jgi:hypothetical protein
MGGWVVLMETLKTLKSGKAGEHKKKFILIFSSRCKGVAARPICWASNQKSFLKQKMEILGMVIYAKRSEILKNNIIN